MRLEVDKQALKELCTKYGTRFAETEEGLVLANNCGTVTTNREITKHEAYLQIIGVESLDDQDNMTEFANAETDLHEEIGMMTIPYLDARSLSDSHNLDAGIERDLKNKKFYMATWLLVKTPEYFLRPIEKIGRIESHLLLRRLNKFTEANTGVYQSAMRQLSDGTHHFYNYLKGKSLEPALPYDVEKIFSK